MYPVLTMYFSFLFSFSFPFNAHLFQHQTTRRYAEFIAAIHLLTNDNNQSMQRNIAALHTQMHKLIQRLSQQLPNKQKQSIFFINNIDHILSVYAVRSFPSSNYSSLFFY